MTNVLFCTGSNWIPADSFLTTYAKPLSLAIMPLIRFRRMTRERYRAWLQLLIDGNQNMVRIWGGGIYEPDIFYDICDGTSLRLLQIISQYAAYSLRLELGILVWQDFQFACGVYPAYAEFVNSVRKEAEDVVQRLRHHPSLALLCGNNEGALTLSVICLHPSSLGRVRLPDGASMGR